MKLKGITQLNKSLKLFSVKVVLIGVAVVLLLSSAVLLTVAWYTKMVSVSGLQFHAAQWDFAANFAVDNIAINVFDYNSLTEGRAAPGTGGEIPLRLAAWQSDTDVEYTVTIDRSQMSKEFQDRIFFYYKEGEGENEIRKYFSGSPDDPNEEALMTGTIIRDGYVDLKIYWEWIYTAPDSVTNEADRTAWDEFDTRVGKNPELYVKDMNAEISIVGVEVNPSSTSSTAAVTTAPTNN